MSRLTWRWLDIAFNVSIAYDVAVTLNRRFLTGVDAYVAERTGSAE
jgi:hypothetical protein